MALPDMYYVCFNALPEFVLKVGVAVPEGITLSREQLIERAIEKAAAQDITVCAESYDRIETEHYILTRKERV